MKKLQRFGIVSLAALTLASLTLANDQVVKADETTPAETNVAPLEPVEELETPRVDEAVDAPTETSEETEEADLSQPASSAPSTPTEHKQVPVNMKHYLITPDGLSFITGGGVMLDSRYPDRTSVKPEAKAFANLDFVGARLSDDKVVNAKFELGKTLSLEDGLSSNTTVNFYYKSKDLELSDTSDYAKLPKRQSNNDSISFQLSYVDDTGRALPGVEDIQYYNLIPGGDLEFVSPDVPGFRAKQASVLASYEALKVRPNEAEYGVSRYLRFVYEKVDNSAVVDLDVAVVHVRLSDTENDFKVLEEKKYTVKSGESLTIQAIDVEGFKPVTKTLTLDYDSLARGHIFGRAYQLYYTKDGQVPEWLKHIGEEPRTGLTGDPIPNFSDKLTIKHIFDDGSSEPRVELEILPLRPDGSVMVPAFREVAGWMPDRTRSTQLSVELPRVPYFLKGGGLREPFAEHVGYHYENLLTAHVFDLYYTKADTKVEEPKPSQPEDNNTTPHTETTAPKDDTPTPSTPPVHTGTESPAPTETTPLLLADKATGLRVLFGKEDADSVVGLKVSHVETNATTTPKVLVGRDFDLFDVVPVDKDGKVVDITTPALVSLPVDTDKQVAKVLYLPSPDKEESLAFKVEQVNGKTYALFTVNHFSQYAIVYQTAAATNTSPTRPVTPSVTPPVSTNKLTTGTASNAAADLVSPIAILTDMENKSEAPVSAQTPVNEKAESQAISAPKQSLSRVESRHLPKTSDSDNLLAVLGVTILTALGLYRPSKRKN